MILSIFEGVVPASAIFCFLLHRLISFFTISNDPRVLSGGYSFLIALSSLAELLSAGTRLSA